ncbi:MAG: hypothetical protein IKZ58_10165 [Selenomonadaceae bacterium]|nr:hypothetical protein [Selenomonadaceae bacterium]
MEVKRLNVPKGTSGLSFRDTRSGQGARQIQRAQMTPDQSQGSAYQISFARRSFFFEEDFNDITIEELAQFMEREEDFVEEVDEEAEKAKMAAAQTQQPSEPEQPVDKRKVAAVAAYDWFASL